MGCNCKKKEGFDLVMSKAQQYEIQTGKKAAIFVINEKTVSMTDLSNIDKVSGICCYFTTDGKEHKTQSVSESKTVASKKTSRKKK